MLGVGQQPTDRSITAEGVKIGLRDQLSRLHAGQQLCQEIAQGTVLQRALAEQGVKGRIHILALGMAFHPTGHRRVLSPPTLPELNGYGQQLGGFRCATGGRSDPLQTTPEPPPFAPVEAPQGEGLPHGVAATQPQAAFNHQAHETKGNGFRSQFLAKIKLPGLHLILLGTEQRRVSGIEWRRLHQQPQPG
jgi:hypothetical protein